MKAKLKSRGARSIESIKMKAGILALPLAAAPAFFGCSAETLDTTVPVESKEQALLPAECEALGDSPNTHVCWHGVLGPIVDVDSSDPDELDEIHDFYAVDLDGSGPYSRTLSFTPENGDNFAIYYDPNVTVTVEDDNDDPVSSQLSGTIASCDALTGSTGEDLSGYDVFELSVADAPYEITFTASVPTINVVLEELTPLRETWFYDGDGDGYGPAPVPRMKTACVPWAPYTGDSLGDCDDNDDQVYPGNGC